MKNVQKGFTLIELMIVVAIVGILTAIALPTYQNYTTRAKVAEVLAAMETAKTAVAETYTSTGTLPTSNSAAGLGAAASYSTTYLTSLTVGAAGLVSAVIRGTNNASIDATTMRLTPTAGTNGQITWVCTNSGTAATVNPFLPQNCRS